MQLEYGGRRVSVTAERMIIGSDPSADLVVAGQGVLPEHLKLRRRPDGVVEVAPASPAAPLLINGHRAAAVPHRLAVGDRLVLGDQEIVALDPDAAQGASRRLHNTMMGVPVMTPEVRAELEARLASPTEPAPAPQASPTRRLVLLAIALAAAGLIAYYFLART